MKYTETLQYLYEQLPMFHRIGASAYKANLNNTLEISKLLGEPEKKFPSIHIAGTNGKGSTSHMLASILQEAGYRTGLFTSPHLKDYRERIRINGRMIRKSEVTAFVRLYKQAFREIQPSFFEWTFALASYYFHKEKVDIAVMETGMGGRLDSTNIVKPILTIITNIGYDHMQFLGDTLEKIAEEKAGIIKAGIPLVVGETHEETSQVFSRVADMQKSSIYFADQSYTVLSHDTFNPGMNRFNLKMQKVGHPGHLNLSCPLTGRYQMKNLATVMQSVEILRAKGFDLSDQLVRNGISHVVRNTGLRGRWELIQRNPVTIADISHNKDGIQETLKHFTSADYIKLHVVIGVVNDKDVDAMLALLPVEATYYFCRANIPRGLDAATLAEKAWKKQLKGKAYPDVKSAVDSARIAAKPGEIVLITGSAFVVAEAI